jgi:hypothetical protein
LAVRSEAGSLMHVFLLIHVILDYYPFAAAVKPQSSSMVIIQMQGEHGAWERSGRIPTTWGQGETFNRSMAQNFTPYSQYSCRRPENLSFYLFQLRARMAKGQHTSRKAKTRKMAMLRVITTVERQEKALFNNAYKTIYSFGGFLLLCVRCCVRAVQ